MDKQKRAVRQDSNSHRIQPLILERDRKRDREKDRERDRERDIERVIERVIERES